MHFVKLATAAAMTMGLATVAIAADQNPPQKSSPSIQSQTDHPATRAMPESSGPSGAAGTGADMRSGATSGPMNADGVKAMLQAQGYTDVKSVDKKGNLFTADAKKDGKSVKVNVDANTGRISDARK